MDALFRTEGRMTIATNLQRIERELDALAAKADAEHAIDPHEVRVIARKVACQREMIEAGLGE
jgi:hypothetical protein